MRLIPWIKRLTSLILTCQDKESLAKIHALVILTGLRGNSNALLIKSYARIADTVEARRVFDKMPQRGVDVWNAMIIVYSREQNPDEVVRLHRLMIAEGVRPDSSSFTVALKACAGLLDLRSGEEIWFKAIEYGYKYDAFVGSSALNLYAKCGRIDEAASLFDKMPKRDLVCWTSMITGFVRSGQPLKAVDIYRRMLKEGVEADGVVMLGLIQACASLGESKVGLSIHGHLIRRDQHLDVVLQTSLVDMYAKFGKLNFACWLFKRMTYKNVISWGALISGYAQNGFAVNALKMLVEMQSCGFKPESVSLVSALLACSQAGFMKLGKSIHGYIVRRLDFDQVSGTAVIDMYSKCGSLSYARALFDKTKTKDLIFWNAMITSYGIHGQGREALLLFLKMTENSKPDHTTFVSLLSAFSHSGLVEEGRKWFLLMQNDFKIQPGEKHYLCMVDLLARAGQVEEAYQLISSMDTEPGLPIWVALLAGCYNHGKLSVGEIAAKNILELNPDDLGVYALISNFYAKEKKWNEVADLKNIMKHSGIKKIPGYSAVEVNGNFHYFLMEDNSHYQHEAILHFLDKLDHEMRIMKYMPEAELLWHNFELHQES
ncbi:putative pentatricopeptide repeat-containing protein At3g25060, mitochondrial [Humulus lupulus]|uniref:putative pentatricopeptide repeat-containing protein At3g25060, mitochondrial n=1 Tax=Humulus lupulus TaxID=3486 RepID=UPI002B4023E1|nr:putative pentatricopeptide repeat-containing protein At3g25060, mitochondrial [Humulus lupulus]